MKKLVIIALLMVGFGSVIAQKPAVMPSAKAGWHKIASQHVNFKTEKEEISVMGNDHFKEIKLIARDAPVELMSFDVYFEKNGEVQTIPVNRTLKAGEETASTALNKDMAIKRIVLVYKTLPNRNAEGEKEKAEVEVWGKK